MSLTLETDGAVRLDRAALSILGELQKIADAQAADRAGMRLRGIPQLSRLLAPTGGLGTLAAARLGEATRPVRAILFNKSEGNNWALGWHQDRIIVVRERIETAGFGPWTIKSGMVHVAPPADLLGGMLTMRVHLDSVPETNAPLQIARGSHRLGRIAERDVDTVVARCGTAACLAEAGDVWLYATPILHASAASSAPRRRRVLQVDFAAVDLPDGLQWLGI
ncbi:phytanoyl-CoA dioxygenase family protein [Sphingomonas bacterium]|uniref:phytanoyl-CoA dioxygenase family protein n=1 Tax=Sphingomonas bacterium TaxID=1895847 RepID=UPI002617005B|nr:phytanoyl-CoA dioxygenase family protein [Sphingomonas bacterium]MDB5677552.1 phytanoyl-CoA dioxygenase [Sphingomonas bacterium]